MRLALAVLVAAVAIAAQATAQDWATNDVCTVDEARIHDTAFAPATREALEAEARTIPNATGKFWRIDAPSGAVSHLWGTYHSADPLILALPEPVAASIDAAATVAVEMDTTFETRDSLRRAQMMEGRFVQGGDPFAFTPGNGTIAGLSPEVSGWVRDRAIELGWTEDFDLVMSLPGIAEMLLSDPCEDFVQGTLPIQDDYIHLLGRLAGARILGLENRDDLVADLAADPETNAAIIATYAAYLKPTDTSAERATSFALYLEGRLGMMAAWDRAFQETVHGADGQPSLARTDAYLLDTRNRRFVDRLTDELDKGGVFIAVGSAHLPGQAGLVALLREAGYTATRIPLPGEAP